MQDAARAGAEHKDREDDFDNRDQRQKSAAQRERLDRVGFEYTSQQLARPLMADAVRLQAQSAEE